MGYLKRVPELVESLQPLPVWVPSEYVYWSAVRQCAADLERAELVGLASQELARVVERERAKQTSFGDTAQQFLPFPDGWEDDGV